MSVRGFFAGLLMTIGGLIAILSGGCVLIFAANIFNLNNPLDTFAFIGIVGGIPFAIGMFIFLIGRLIRPAKKPRPPKRPNRI